MQLQYLHKQEIADLLATAQGLADCGNCFVEASKESPEPKGKGGITEPEFSQNQDPKCDKLINAKKAKSFTDLLSTSLKKLLDKIQTENSLYDTSKENTVSLLENTDYTSNKTALKKNLCGEYLMLQEAITSASPTTGIATASKYLVAPKGKKAISSFFKSDVEYYQYLVLRWAYSDKVGCTKFKLGTDVYLDTEFFKKREKLLLFLGSGFSSMNYLALKAGIRSSAQWEEFKKEVIADLFDDSKSQQIQVDWIESVQRAEKAYTIGELVGAIPFESYVGTAKFASNALKTASKSSIVGRFVNLVKGLFKNTSNLLTKIETATFYSVQNADDIARLKAGGTPWATEPTRSHLGSGVYTWATEAEAQSYLAIKLTRTPDVKIIKLEIKVTDLSKLKSFKVPLNDDLANAWLQKYSSLYGKGLPHGFQYVQGNVGIGTEHYFSSDVFHLFKIK